MPFLQPHIYTREELETISSDAKRAFRLERIESEKKWAEFYSKEFSSTFERMDEILKETDDLSSIADKCSELLRDGNLDLLRYLDRPTVSEDDFKSLSETGTISARKLAEEPLSSLAAEFITRNLNKDIFPWLEDAADSVEESDELAAKRAVAALVAEQKTKTAMRNEASKTQESSVREALESECGFISVEGGDFSSPRQAPDAGTYFKKETNVAGTRADIVLGLHDGRFMAIECKVSNSEVNSFKRLNHEAVEKAKKWNTAFGTNGVVSAAVISGVFKTSDLETAQRDGIYLFWSHDLHGLSAFINACREQQD